MNITQIKQLQTVDGWIDCNAQIKEVKEIKQRTKSNLSKTPGQKYNVQKLVIQDDTDIISLWAYANQQFMPGQIVSVHGMVKEYQNKRYLDYCDIKTDTNTPQNPQQAPSPPTQATNYQPPAPQGMSQQDAASFAINAAARIFGEAPKEMPANEAAKLLIQIAEPIKEWILGKQYKANPNQSSQNGPIEAEFCDECRNLKEECTCNPSY